MYQQTAGSGLYDDTKNFANFLRCASVDCETTHYHDLDRINDWNVWCMQQINMSKFVLLVCTTELNELISSQSDERIEMPPGYIMSSNLKGLLYENTSSFFVPIVLEKDAKVPLCLSSRTRYVISLIKLTETIKELTSGTCEATEDHIVTLLDKSEFGDLKRLVARLTDQSLNPKPIVAKSKPNLTSKFK